MTAVLNPNNVTHKNVKDCNIQESKTVKSIILNLCKIQESQSKKHRNPPRNCELNINQLQQRTNILKNNKTLESDITLPKAA